MKYNAVKMSAIIPFVAEDVIALAVTRSLGKRSVKTIAISKYKHPITFYSKYCSERIISEINLDLFSRFTEEDVVMPIDEKVMCFLAKHRNEIPCVLPFPDFPLIEKTNNKYLITRQAQDLGISCPRTFPLSSVEDIEKVGEMIHFPAVLKPVHSKSGIGIQFIRSMDELIKRYSETSKLFNPCLIQEKIPFNEKFTVGVLMNREGKARSGCVLKEVRWYPTDRGPSSLVETVDKPDLLDLSVKLLESLPYYGVADIDWVIDSRDGMPKLMEVNPRIWGSVQGAISAGMDIPYLLYQMAQDGDIHPSFEYKKGVRCRYLVFRDMERLRSVMKGRSSLARKVQSLKEFMEFNKDNCYFVFSSNDVKPFFVFVFIKIYFKIIEG